MKNYLIKYLFLLSSLLFFTNSLFSQRFHAGLSAGISTTQVDGDTYSGYNKIGLTAGGFVSTNISSSEKWKASFEIDYIQKGSHKIPHPDKLDYTNYLLRLNYVEVPLLLKYQLSSVTMIVDSVETTHPKFSVEAGTSFGALVHAEEYSQYSQVIGGTPFEKYEWAFLIGLNYSFKKKMSINIRYEYSILPVRNNKIASYNIYWWNKLFSRGYYNNVLVFTLQYLF
ncbi:MAG: outer membrane beta-barrel protein [Bacteroidota bacterium]